MLHEQLKDYQNNKITNKKFGLQLSLIFFIIFLFGLYFKFSLKTELFLLSISFTLILVSFIKPVYLNIINIFFLKLSKFISIILNPLIMFVFYIFIFFPFGLILKFFNYDPLKEKNNNKLNTFWINSDKSDKKFFKNQF
tara:strand:- start:172 stop:588 length:417 start_codon:yes stop_codon:yes gene_type:complete